MSQLEVGRKMQQIRGQYSYVFKITDWVCLQNVTDYSPFGGALDGRTMEGEGYRYGYNGKEADNEIKGEGNSYDFGARMHDPRLGRFMSLDKYSRKFPNESNYIFASNSPISAIDINGDSTYLIIYGANYLNYTMAGGDHDVGNGFLLNAEALKKTIESSTTFDPNRDAVVLVYAPSSDRFIEATNKTYTTGKIASMTVFSHGYGFSETNGTNTGGVSLGGEKPGETRPDGTSVTQADADAQLNNYDKRELNGNNLSLVNTTNFESTAKITFYGCYIGGSTKWTDLQIETYAFAQRVSNAIGVTVQAFTGSGLFKSKNGKNTYDGTMIRAEDAKTQKTRLSTFKPNVTPTIIKK